MNLTEKFYHQERAALFLAVGSLASDCGAVLQNRSFSTFSGECVMYDAAISNQLMCLRHDYVRPGRVCFTIELSLNPDEGEARAHCTVALHPVTDADEHGIMTQSEFLSALRNYIRRVRFNDLRSLLNGDMEHLASEFRYFARDFPESSGKLSHFLSIQLAPSDRFFIETLHECLREMVTRKGVGAVAGYPEFSGLFADHQSCHESLQSQTGSKLRQMIAALSRLTGFRRTAAD